jgi:phage repressor protein C with HTH and peptisase S24 domain
MKKKLFLCLFCLTCVGLRVAYGEEVDDSKNTHPLTYAVLYPGYIAIRMKDDSMSPVIDEGDAVFASRHEAYKEHAIHIVRVKSSDEKFIRKVSEEEDGLLLTPINEKYPPQLVLHEEVAEIIRVIHANRDVKKAA